MNLVLWIVAGVLAAASLGAGFNKISVPRAKLMQSPQFAWAGDFTQSQLRAIGAAEVLGAIGLILPRALDIAPVLTPLAAVGLALVQVGAFLTHRRRGEKQVLPINVVLFAAAAFVAIGRLAGA